jgi:RNA polymerase sigma factor (sigma-70 family)
MVATQASKVFHCIRSLALHQHNEATDGDLLDLYVRQKDEVAFEALVRRHSRMVLGVCRRILGNSHDAEDAFQATFLVLVRKAASIRPAGMVGNWLYGVAHRTALEARRSAAKRRAKEAQVAPRIETPDDALADLRPFLNQELDGLPDKYRAALVLCDLEGRTRKEAAQQLGLPEGTVASRQARARTILAKRLTRHGVTLSGGALVAALAQEAVSASAPLSLVFATVRAATAYAAEPATAAAVASAPVAALTEGVLRTMLLSKLKITALLLVVIGLAGTGWSNYWTLASDQSAVQGKQQVAQADLKQTKAVQPKEGNAKKQDGKKAPDEKKQPAEDQASQAFDMMLKGLQAYQASKSKEGQRPDKQASDLYAEAFLKAFQISSAIAKRLQAYQGKDGEQRSKDVDLYAEAAFVQAYERAKALKKTLEEPKALDGKGSDKAIEALDVFLKAGKKFEQAVKLRAKNLAVEHARKEIENALSRMEKTAHDRQAELEALDEIESVLQEVRKKIQERKGGK